MTLNLLCRALTLTVALWGVTAATAHTQEPRPRVQVDVRLLSTSRTGATDPSSVVSGKDVAVGDAWVTGVYGGFDGSRGTAAWPLEGTSGFTWRVEVKPVAVQVDTVQLAIQWGRYRGGSGPEALETGDTRIVNLMTGQRHVLDLVQSDTPASPDANLVMEVSARLVGDAAYARASLDYELWLVHNGAAGQATTRRLQVVGTQGQWSRFSFRPIGFALNGRILPSEAPAPLAAYADGEILGRLRPDGTVGLAIRTAFGIDCAVAGRSEERGGGRSGGRGLKELVVRQDDVLSLELPTRVGWCTIVPPPAVPPDARPGIRPANGGVRVTGADFFGNDRFTLVVSARERK